MIDGQGDARWPELERFRPYQGATKSDAATDHREFGIIAASIIPEMSVRRLQCRCVLPPLGKSWTVCPSEIEERCKISKFIAPGVELAYDGRGTALD